jgi:hypothetical protein
MIPVISNSRSSLTLNNFSTAQNREASGRNKQILSDLMFKKNHLALKNFTMLCSRHGVAPEFLPYVYEDKKKNAHYHRFLAYVVNELVPLCDGNRSDYVDDENNILASISLINSSIGVVRGNIKLVPKTVPKIKTVRNQLCADVTRIDPSSVPKDMPELSFYANWEKQHRLKENRPGLRKTDEHATRARLITENIELLPGETSEDLLFYVDSLEFMTKFYNTKSYDDLNKKFSVLFKQTAKTETSSICCNFSEEAQGCFDLLLQMTSLQCNPPSDDNNNDIYDNNNNNNSNNININIKSYNTILQSAENINKEIKMSLIHDDYGGSGSGSGSGNTTVQPILGDNFSQVV